MQERVDARITVLPYDPEKIRARCRRMALEIDDLDVAFPEHASSVLLADVHRFAVDGATRE